MARQFSKLIKCVCKENAEVTCFSSYDGLGKLTLRLFDVACLDEKCNRQTGFYKNRRLAIAAWNKREFQVGKNKRRIF